jgi:hypothetical protein
MDDLYDINFQSNNEFCKIHIPYNVIQYSCTMYHLRDMCMLDETLILLKRAVLYTAKTILANFVNTKKAI